MPPTIADPQTLEQPAPTVPAHAVKFVGPDTIEGPAFIFGTTHLDGESFDADTDFCIEWFGKSGRPLLYEHGMDSALRTSVVGRQSEFEKRDEGIWAQGQLEAGAKYRKAIDALIEQGALSYSGGAMQHLALKSAATGRITRFPWVELSLTPTPMDPANASGVYFLKSAQALEHIEAAGSLIIPDPLKAALTALDEWADSREEHPVPEALADRLDRVSVELGGLQEHAREVAAMRAKSGRVLSAATRERLLRHPSSLRELADDLDELLSNADAEKSTDIAALEIETERILSRLLGVAV